MNTRQVIGFSGGILKANRLESCWKLKLNQIIQGRVKTRTVYFVPYLKQ